MDVTTASTTATNSQTTTAQTNTSADVTQSLGQEDFLKLMVAQVQNQDPFAPMENGDFIGQMAQFSSVDGINEMNASLEKMSSAFSHGQSLQAATLVGRQVVAPTPTATLTTGNSIVGEVDLTEGVSALVVDVKDSSGSIVKSIDLGPQAAGRVSFEWDGVGDDGNQQLAGDYRLSANAMLNGERAYFSTMMPIKVESVAVGAGVQTPQLTLADGTKIGLDKVEQIH